MWTSSSSVTPLEFAGDDFPGDGGEGLFDGATLLGGEHADFFQHGGMGQRAEDVLFPEPPIKGDRLGESGGAGIEFAAEPPAARNWRRALQNALNVRRPERKVTLEVCFTLPFTFRRDPVGVVALQDYAIDNCVIEDLLLVICRSPRLAAVFWRLWPSQWPFPDAANCHGRSDSFAGLMRLLFT